MILFYRRYMESFDYGTLPICPHGISNVQELYKYKVDVDVNFYNGYEKFPELSKIIIGEFHNGMVRVVTPRGNIWIPYSLPVNAILLLYFEVFADISINHHSYSVFPIHAGQIVVDGGVFEGFYTLKALNAGAHVLACEPYTAMHPVLRKSFEPNTRFTLTEYGLGDIVGESLFNESTWSSSFCGQQDVEDNKPICMRRMITIDALLKESGLARIDHIKMDVENMEYRAILGAKETIKKYKPFLSIMTYHGYLNAFWIYSFLEAICPEYKICLYGNYFGMPHALYAYV
jgi:FkbM family methyltransferase